MEFVSEIVVLKPKLAIVFLIIGISLLILAELILEHGSASYWIATVSGALATYMGVRSLLWLLFSLLEPIEHDNEDIQ